MPCQGGTEAESREVLGDRVPKKHLPFVFCEKSPEDSGICELNCTHTLPGRTAVLLWEFAMNHRGVDGSLNARRHAIMRCRSRLSNFSRPRPSVLPVRKLSSKPPRTWIGAAERSPSLSLLRRCGMQPELQAKNWIAHKMKPPPHATARSQPDSWNASKEGLTVRCLQSPHSPLLPARLLQALLYVVCCRES